MQCICNVIRPCALILETFSFFLKKEYKKIKKKKSYHLKSKGKGKS